MSQQHSADNPTDGPAIVAWGSEPAARPGRRPLLIGAVRRGRRFGPVVAALGTVAIFASLVTEWAVTTLPGASPDGRGPLDVPQTVNDIGSFGTAYLIGVLALAGSVTLALFGTAPIRRNVRVGGLTLAAGLLVMLVALAAALGRIMSRYFFSGGETLVVEYGRGLVMAFAGVAALGAALLLAGGGASAAAGSTAGTGGGKHGRDETDWSWQRSRATGEPEATDVAVTPAEPFAGPDAGTPVIGPQPREEPRTTAPDATDRYRRESRSGPR
jgi:hypothetical protein